MLEARRHARAGGAVDRLDHHRLPPQLRRLRADVRGPASPDPEDDDGARRIAARQAGAPHRLGGACLCVSARPVRLRARRAGHRGRGERRIFGAALWVSAVSVLSILRRPASGREGRHARGGDRDGVSLG